MAKKKYELLKKERKINISLSIKDLSSLSIKIRKKEEKLN